jgi:hypothetical protein
VLNVGGDVLVILAKMGRQGGAKRRHLATEDDIKAGKQSKLDLGRLFPKATTTPPAPVTPEIVDVAQIIPQGA